MITITATFRGGWKSRARSRARRAFTLVELLVVIAVTVLVIAVSVPAIGRLIESANFSAAVNTVSATLGNARAQAMRTQRYTAVAFLFDIEARRYTLLPLELASNAGSLTKASRTPTIVQALVMRPQTGAAPVRLPRGTAVFGLSFLLEPEDAMFDPETFSWYAGEIIDEDNPERLIPWIFPRNDPSVFVDEDEDPWYDISDDDRASDPEREAVRHANSFCILFSPDGSIETTPSVGSAATHTSLYIEYPDLPYFLNDPEAVPFDDPLAFDPEVRTVFGSATPVDTGDVWTPNPEVILRPASQLAVVDLNRMISGTGVDRPWLLRPSTSNARRNDPNRFLDGAEFGFTDADEAVQRLSRWIDQNAEILGFNRYTGAVIKR